MKRCVRAPHERLDRIAERRRRRKRIVDDAIDEHDRDWVDALVSIFAAARTNIDSAVDHAKRMESDDLLKELRQG